MLANDAPNENDDDDDERLRQKHINSWHETWEAFTAALRSTDDFSAFEWTLKLLKSGSCFAYFKFGLYKFKVHAYWRSWVPAFAIVLIVVVVLSYFGSLRDIIKERWCCPTVGIDAGTIESCPLVDENDSCRWLFFHDTVVVYLGIMIIFNFLSACFRSPGVVLSKPQQQPRDNETKEPVITTMEPNCQKWSSRDSRGGFCGMDPVLDIAREEFLVQNYYNIAGFSNAESRECTTNINSKVKRIEAFPSSLETFCNKCRIKRPPRCHHCSVCDRCVLQFDHHCVWLNNCVGYNNLRAFLLTLFYLNIGCWYGIAMLYRPFFEVLNKNSNGWHFLHDNGNAFLELPSVSTFISCVLNGTMEKETVNKVVFPFLFAIGLLQAVFFGYHVRYAASALTTLEYKILLDMKFKQLVEHPSSRCVTPPNPFSRGWSQNLKNAFGPITLIFLPIQVDPKQINLTSDGSAKKKN